MRCWPTLLIVLLLAYSQSANAYLPAEFRTESKVPVTIKIGDVYFNIPEGSIEHLFMRAPVERDDMLFSLPFSIFDPTLTDENYPHQRIEVRLTNNKPANLRGGQKSYPLYKGVYAIIFQYAIEGIEPVQVVDYLYSISSTQPPENWEKDNALAKKTNFGEAPPSDVITIDLNNPPPPKIPPKPKPLSRSEIDYLLEHKTETMQMAAIPQLATFGEVDPAYAAEKILYILHHSPSLDARYFAVYSLKTLAEKDPTLTEHLLEVMMNDESPAVRSNAASVLSPLNPSAERIIALTKNAKPENYKYLTDLLAWIINNEVRKYKLTSPDQLSLNAQKSLDTIITLLPRMEERDVESILRTLRNSDSAVATEHYLAFLKDSLQRGKGLIVGYAAESLINLGDKAIVEALPLMIKRLETTHNFDEIYGILWAFMQLRSPHPEIIPVLLKYTSFDKENPSTDYRDAYKTSATIRLKAINLIYAQNIRTPEIEAAMIKASKDPEADVRAAAQRYLNPPPLSY